MLYVIGKRMDVHGSTSTQMRKLQLYDRMETLTADPWWPGAPGMPDCPGAPYRERERKRIVRSPTEVLRFLL